MKHLKTFTEKILENKSFINGDEVMILYKIPGTEQRELVPVKIIKKIDGSNTYLVSFNIEGNPFTNQRDMIVKTNKIIGPYQSIREPSPGWAITTQPVGTDYNAADKGPSSGGVSNDYVLPNS